MRRAALRCPLLSCSKRRPHPSPHLHLRTTAPPPQGPAAGCSLFPAPISIMKRLLRRLFRVAAADAWDAAAYHTLRPDASTSAKASALSGARRLGGGTRVPEGHVPVCVGEEGGPVERYAVRAEFLGRPAFAALLRRAAQEYGYGHPGALRIPCPVADFRDLLLQPSTCAAADHPEFR